MSNEERLIIYRDFVRSEWVDYNGHLRDAFYMLLFSFAADALIDAIGLDDAQRKARRHSLFTLEAHVNYLHEIKEGAQVRVTVRVIAHDAKRLHVYLEMFADGRDQPVAAGEQMLLHVDMAGPKAAPFDADVLEKVSDLAAAHAVLPPARFTGRTVRL